MSLISQYAKDYWERSRSHGQAVADGVSTAPVATSTVADDRAPGGAPSPQAQGAPSDVDPADVRAMDEAEWDAEVEQMTRLFTCRLDGD